MDNATKTTDARARPNQSWKQWSEHYAKLMESWDQQTTREIELADDKLKGYDLPPRPHIPDSLREVSLAYSAIAKIPSGADKSVYQTGFFIAEDGFLLTTSDIYPSAHRDTSVVTCFDGIGFYCDHVQDFKICGISLSLVRGVTPFPIPFLMPEEGELDPMAPMVFMPFGADDIAYPSPVVVQGHIISSEDPNSGLASLELDQPNLLDYAEDDTLFSGGPVLSLRPHHFVGVVSKIEQDSVIRFCSVTQNSSVWMEIKGAMDKYRETHVTRRWLQMAPPDNHEFCCTLL